MSKSIYILGLRGVNGVQGGIETHVENLAPLLAEAGCSVTVLARKGYQPELPGDQYRGVQVKTLPSPKSKGLEAVIHSFIGVLYAAVKRPDVLHIHAIGPSLVVPMARLFGLKVVMTHHGPDYDRQKWGRFAKSILKLGEFLGVRFANKVIVISKTIEQLVQDKHHVNPVVIPNGVNVNPLLPTVSALKKYQLEPEKYILIVSRLVPEKRHLDLIAAFEKANINGWKLVIVGSSDHPDEYSNAVNQAAENNSDIIATGFLSGVGLAELFSHAGLFVLPSSHEGLPIALLEALSYGLPVLVSDIAPHLEVELEAGDYFELGNVDDLAQKLIAKTQQSHHSKQREETREWVQSKYDWKQVANQALEVYQSLD